METIPIGSRHVFVDESGDPSLDSHIPGVSEYFVLSAVIVESENLPEEESKIHTIIDKYFPKGELKSSRVGSNLPRRMKILKEITKVNFKHYTQVIDKDRIRPDTGLRYKRSFIKYFNRVLYSQLFKAFTKLYIIADQYSTSEFMYGFSDYLQRRLQRGLFENHTFTFAPSADHPFIQIADIIAGTIRRCYSGEDDLSVLEPLRSHTIIIDEWPPHIPEPIGLKKLPPDDQLDYLIRRHAVLQAERFIEENSPKGDPNIQAQVAGARYLLYYYRSVDPTDYVPTAALRQSLIELGFHLTERSVRSKVISPLRNHGVFIASSRKGIKIPYSVDDLYRYVENVSAQVVPYINSLRICREHFLIATEGNLDIITAEFFPELNKYVGDD